MSQLTSNKIVTQASRAAQISIEKGQAGVLFVKGMPKLMKQTAILAGAASFTAALAMTMITLAPDQRDHERKVELNQQFSEASQQAHFKAQ